MSLYNQDKETEEIVSRWTEKNIFNKTNFEGEYIREDSARAQKSGVDIILKSNELFGDEKYHTVDEKSATNYIRTNLKEDNIHTFAFEIDYKNRNNEKRNEGWLFGNQFANTEYYLISWIWANVSKDKRGFGIKTEVTMDNILKARLFLINKERIHHYLENFKVTKNNFMRVSERIRHLDETKKVISKSNNRTPNVQYSEHLEEKPVNVIISEHNLRELSTKIWE